MTSEYKKDPKGYFKFLLAIDAETTGLNRDTDDPSVGHQCVSWGIIVADAMTFEPIEKLYLEIKWNDKSIAAREEDPSFGKYAETIHGLSFEYLEEHGVTEEEAVVQILNLILKYWGPTVMVKALGHNVHSFDVPFMREMFRRHGVEVPFGSRHYDTNSIGFGTVGAYISDALFTTMGYDHRSTHNALDDIEQALGSCQRIRLLWDRYVKVNAYDHSNLLN